MEAPSIAQRIEHRRKDEIHPCIRPGCGRQARTAMHVDSPMRLGGRDFMPGEFVDLCWGDYDELHRAVSDALAMGFGGPFARTAALLAEAEPDAANPLDRLREWAS